MWLVWLMWLDEVVAGVVGWGGLVWLDGWVGVVG